MPAEWHEGMRPWQRTWRVESREGAVVLPPDLPVAALRRAGGGRLIARLGLCRAPAGGGPAVAMRIWRLVRCAGRSPMGPLRPARASTVQALTALEAVDILPAG